MDGQGIFLKERIEKFNKQYLSNDGTSGGKIILAREKNLLSLRKNKIDEELWNRRMNSYIKNFSNKEYFEKYNYLTINLEELLPYLPEFFDEEFNIYDEKITKVTEILLDYKLSINNNITKEAFMRYALVKLRDLSMICEKNNYEVYEDMFEEKLILTLVELLTKLEDNRVKYEILHILINITYESKKFSTLLINHDFLKYLLVNCLNSQEIGLVNHTIWLLSNLITLEECGLIISIIPELPIEFSKLLKKFQNLFTHLDIIKVTSWAIYRIIKFHKEVIPRFHQIIPELISFFDYEIQNLMLIKDNIINIKYTEH